MSVSHPKNIKTCHRLQDSNHDVSGSTSCCIEDMAYTIGGCVGNQIGKKPFLQVDCLDLVSKLWMPTYLNSNGILNRSYHCSCVIDRDIYLFGGCTTGNESCNQNSDEVIRVHKTVFGLVSTIHSVDNSVSCQGQSVSIMGKSKSYILLYGGMTFVKDDIDHSGVSVVFKSNLVTFSYIHSEASFCSVEIAPEDDVPPGRAFHTAVVCGDDSEYLIICGGRNGEMCLNDIWLLDMTSILLTVDSADSSTKEKKITDSLKDKKPASTKRKGTFPTARWSRVKVQGEIPFLSRQLHCSYFIPCKDYGPNSSSSGHIYFFGGLSESGMLRSAVEEYEITISDKSAVMTLIEDSSIESDTLDDSLCGFGSSTSLYFGAAAVSCSLPKGLLIFGGNYEKNGTKCPSYSKCILFEETNNILIKGLRTATPGHDDNLESSEEKLNAIEDDDASTTRDVSVAESSIACHRDMEYDMNNGRLIYEGDFLRGVYHGYGKLIAEDGNVYCGSFANGVKDGNGVLTLSTGTVYTGSWVSDVMLNGSFVTSLHISKVPASKNFGSDSGVKLDRKKEMEDLSGLYDGYIINNVPFDTDGVCRYSDGGEYRGSWRSGRRNGQGTYHRKGSVYTGKWVADERSGRGLWTAVTGDSYEGIWEKDLPHGFGIRKYSAKSVYTGYFFRGKRSGMGVMIFDNGSEYSGLWDHGSPVRSS